MRLEELHLMAFGRFQGRRVQLTPGLNVIYGANESGKSTIQKFLLGMLYGFQKRGQKRSYTDDVTRYRPWGALGYRGSVVYALDDGRRYRAEREFEPGRDGVRLYDHVTGADLTDRFAVDRRKELLFAREHIGLEEEAFRATAWVGQLAVGELDGARELVSRVANLQESGREDVSVKAALAWLEGRASELGTERAATRPYGRVMRNLAQKRQELERATGARAQMRDWEAALAEVQAVLASLDEEMSAVRLGLEWGLLAEAEARLERASAASARVRELREEVRALEAYADFPADGLIRLRRLQAEAADAEERAAAWRSRAAALAEEHRSAVAAIDRQMAALPERGPVWTYAAVGAVAVGFLAMAVVVPGAAVWFAGLGVVVAVAGFVLLQRRGAAGRQERTRLEQARAKLPAFQVEEAEGRAEAEGARAGTAAAEARAILAAASVSDAAAFEEGGARRERYAKAKAEAATLEALVRTQLDGESPQALAAEVERLRSGLVGEAPAGAAGRPSVALREELRRLEARRGELNVRAGELNARIETAMREVPDTAELLRELEALSEEKAGYDFELQALQLASSTIADVAGEIHREFAPRLGRAMGMAASALTGGRYGSVQVDEAAAIRVITDEGRTVELASLSGGAVDQLYLSLRLALLDLITEGQEQVPLLLDDPFVQYDDRRAAGAIALLAGAARERQVILMTCHRREVELAGARAHIIELPDAAAEGNA